MNKYGVGQAVYWICDNSVHPDMLVINRVSIDDQGYHYSLTDSNEDIIDWCREEDVFIQRESAEEESARRNNTITIGV